MNMSYDLTSPSPTRALCQHCTMYNHSHDSSCSECHLPSSSLKIQSSAIPSRFYVHLVPFIKTILTCHKHYIISNFCRTNRYKHQYKIRFMILCYLQLNRISSMDASAFLSLLPLYTLEQPCRLLNMKRLLNE